MSALRIENLTFAFGRRVLFEGLTAEAAAGQSLVISGANGSGKSTLLQLIAGLRRPDAGRVERPGPVGYAAPDAHLYGELTARENLAFYARLRGIALEDGDGLLASVGLGKRREPITAYSSGMRQRLKLAVSLLGRPDLLVWDEPTLALDDAGRGAVDALLSAHRARGGVAVLASNDPAEAARWAQGGRRLALG